MLVGLKGCMGHLDKAVVKSKEQFDKGGFHKIRAQMLWQRTSKVIDKVRKTPTGENHMVNIAKL